MAPDGRPAFQVRRTSHIWIVDLLIIGHPFAPGDCVSEYSPIIFVSHPDPIFLPFLGD
ncbi:hypothetical protein MesloDRAFT_2005 [Mesorhizobium japonicum R7A]|nr:hypothetical protein MesloDRAFT_2005 [Mesorhizobium japonicum R7A]